MGWREREWAKFTDDEWHQILGPRRDVAAPPPLRTTATLAPRRFPAVTLLAALVTLLATALAVLVHLRTTAHVPSQPAAPTHVLHVHWRASDLAPAAGPGRICIDAPALGHVCSSYAAGMRPADALSSLLRASGITVHGS